MTARKGDIKLKFPNRIRIISIQNICFYRFLAYFAKLEFSNSFPAFQDTVKCFLIFSLPHFCFTEYNKTLIVFSLHDCDNLSFYQIDKRTMAKEKRWEQKVVYLFCLQAFRAIFGILLYNLWTKGIFQEISEMLCEKVENLVLNNRPFGNAFFRRYARLRSRP